jgi:uncharacterized protein (TIGR02284 family)
MTNTASTLKDLIELLHDGEKFYTDAASKVSSSVYTELFQRMAQTKRSIASDLSVHVTARGETPPDGGTIFGSLRKTYTDVAASLGKDKESVYVSQLEQTEDRLLEAFQKELTTNDNPEVRRIVERYYPEVKRAHDEMAQLKARIAA